MAKSHIGKRNNSRTEVATGPLKYLLYALIPIALLAPFFRGLFFDQELSVLHMYTAIVAFLYIYFKKDEFRAPRNLTTYSAVGLILSYLITTFFAYNLRGAIGGVFRITNYFVIFLLTVSAGKSINDLRKLMQALFLSGIGVAFIGLGNAYGSFFNDGAYTDGFISSTLQYHNAAAIYMMATGIVGLYLSTSSTKLVSKLMIAVGNYVIFLTALGAGSRGAILVTPIAMLVQFISLSKEDKLKYFYSFVSLGIAFLATSKVALSFASYSEGAHWGAVLVGILITFVLQYIFEKAGHVGLKLNKKYIVTAIGVAFVLLAIVVAVKGQELLPSSFTDRVKSINLSENNAQERFYFYKDAMKIVREHPMGIGAKGWNSAYRAYQSYLYHTTEVHSHPLQVWVEAGTQGLIFYILLWISIFATAIKLWRSDADSNIKSLGMSAFAAAVALGLHSCIDFTYSLGATMVLTWTCFGILHACAQKVHQEERFFELNPKIARFIALVAFGLFFVVNTSFFIAGTYQTNGYTDYDAGNSDAALNDFKTAVTFDPFNAEYNFDLASLYAEKNLPNEALHNAENAVKYSKGDSQYSGLLTRILIQTNNLGRAVTQAEKSLQLAPYVYLSHELLAQTYVIAAEDAFNQGDKLTAKQFALKTLAIPENMQKMDAALTPKEIEMFKGERLNKVSPTLQEQINTAREILSKS